MLVFWAFWQEAFSPAETATFRTFLYLLKRHLILEEGVDPNSKH